MRKLTLLFTFLIGFGLLSAQNTETFRVLKDLNSDIVVGEKATEISKTPTAAKGPLNESFEGNFLPHGWNLIDQDGDGFQWFGYENAGLAHTGSWCLFSESWDPDAGALTPNNHLITPALDPVAGDSISYWRAAQDPDYPADKYQVLVSTTGIAVADFTDTLFVETLTATDTTWGRKAFDLSSYAGQTIYVSFNHFDCTDWYVMKLDDVQGPEANPVSNSIEEAKETEFKMYPNPANDVLNIEADAKITKIRVFNVVGQEVINLDNNSNNYNLNTTNLESGMYIVQIETENSTLTQKINIER